MSKTSISETIELVQKMNSGFLAKGVSGTWYTFKVDEVNSSVSILSKSQYEHFEKKTVDSNALIDFNTVQQEQSEITYEDAAYVEEKRFGNYAIAYCDYDGNNRFVVTNRITNKSFIVPTDIEFVRFEFADIGPLYDDVIDGGITRIGNIVGVINDPVEGKVIRSYSIKVPDVNGEIKTYDDCVDIEGISLIANADHPVIVGDNFSIVNLQNRFIGVINDEKIYMYSLSAAWRLIKNDVGIDLAAPITDSKFTTIVVGDLIYIINPEHKRTVAMCVPYEGNLVNILDGKNFKEVAIDDNFYNIINAIIPYSSAFFAENDRICKIDDIGIYFNTLYNCSEYYNKFVGVDGSGEVIDNIVPISEYDISYITVSDETNQATLRSNENVKTTIRMIYKSTKNLVSEITAISRLNTAKFKVLYSKTNDDEIGNIYSFLDTEINGQLVRDDTSYYRGDYSVVVVNNSIIKINVDGEIYTYLRADNEIPLYNIILPLVIVYGERENKQGNLEARYLSFVDIKGNLITYDKELKSFIDISGYVDIEIPFFSTEAMIYPSKSNLMTDKDALVEMKVKSTE